MRPLLQAVAAASTAGTIPRVHERALRLVPRGLFLAPVPPALSYANKEVTLNEGGAAIEPPHVDVLILQKLRLSPGQRFLEIGCGSGYMTMLAAYLVGPDGQATGVDTSKEAFATSKRLAGQFLALERLSPRLTAPRFLHRDGGTMIEVGETWHAVCVSGHVPAVWIKTLRKLLAPRGRLVASTDGKLRLYEQGGPKGSTSTVIGDYVFPSMALSRRIKRSDAAPSVSKRSSSNGPRAIGKVRPGAKSGGSSAGVEEGLALRVPGRGLLAGGDGGAEQAGGDDDDSAMAEVMREVEMEEMSGLLVSAGDVEICRTPKGRKCRLGEGGFGVVYKALMNGVDEVAVKLVKAEKPSAKDMDLFLKEVRTLAKLHHRNIVQFYGASLDPGSSMFFVTELMKGGDLYSALRHHPETMRWDKLGKKVALDVALGINYLHTRRPPLLHRDLKSPNVLLSEEGVAKIADVGMVRSQVKDLVTAQPVMTPLWAAPEVMRHERASVKADIWSYGILIWELISGKDITECQPLAISRQSGQSPRGKLMKLPAKCPAVVLKVYTECTKMEPDERPTSQDIVEWLRES